MRYIESIVCHCLETSAEEEEMQQSPPQPQANESDDMFEQHLKRDAHCVAARFQIHSQKHFATCFKYQGPGPCQCWFGMP